MADGITFITEAPFIGGPWDGGRMALRWDGPQDAPRNRYGERLHVEGHVGYYELTGDSSHVVIVPIWRWHEGN